jgi:hypothetical protein
LTLVERFFTGRTPDFRRILLIESGSRSASEAWLRWLHRDYPGASVDLLTCFEGEPLPPGKLAAVYRTGGYLTSAARADLAGEFRRNSYDLLAVLATNEPIMTKWKWYLVWKLPVKVMLVNESGDWFWLDRTQWKTLKHFLAVRTGLAGSGALTQPLRILAFPLLVLWLLLFAAWIHARRALRPRML